MSMMFDIDIVEGKIMFQHGCNRIHGKYTLLRDTPDNSSKKHFWNSL